MKHLLPLTKILVCFLTVLVITNLSAQNNFTSDYLVVRLNHKLVDFERIDNNSFNLTELSTFLNNQGREELNRLKDSILDLGNLEVEKIFPHLKTKDSISISRSGKRVYMPPFWATFKIYRPKHIDILTFQRSLNNSHPIVIYAHPDYIGEPENLPNDTYFGNQISLYNFSVPTADINIDSAWTIETGKNFIKVGVFDSGIDSTHEDLDVLTGWGYNDDYLHTWGVDSLGHGTHVAGIIGARRNNSIGIAGIAGGDGTDTTGVRLIDFRLDSSPNGQFSALGASQGMIDAARSVGTYYDWSTAGLGDGPYLENSPGYGLHITNHSYAMRTDASNKSTSNLKEIGTNSGGIGGGDVDINPDYPDCQLCRESFLFSLQNGVTNVVARGNRSLSQPSIPLEGYEKYPYSYHDSWVISVGSSGLDGNWLDGQTNNSNFEAYHSYIGRDIDLIAPGTDSLIVTTHTSLALPTTDYVHFSGSSSAAPHAAGVAALLLSKYNKSCYSNVNLDPADVEYILQKSATDVNDPSYDARAGWGRLDAYKALKMIDLPKFQIIHPENEPDTVILLANDTITCFLNNPLYFFAGGPLGSQFPLELNRYYKVERRKYELTYYFSQYIQGNTQLLDAWVRHSMTNTLILTNDTTYQLVPISPGNPVMTLEMVEDTFKIEPMATITLLDATNKKIKLTGYNYHFVGRHLNDVNSPLINENFWYPINPNIDTLKTAYSIYIRDTTLLSIYDFPCTADNLLYDSLASIESLNLSDELEMKIYPNPGTTLNVSLNGQPDESKLQLFSVTGQLVSQLNIEKNKNSYLFNVEGLKSGFYFINISDNYGILLSKKWIKL
jgi:subtilisin family serine protease